MQELFLLDKHYLQEQLASKKGVFVRSPSLQPVEGEPVGFSQAVYESMIAKITPRMEGSSLVIPLHGALAYDDPIGKFYGETDYCSLQASIENGLADPAVEKIYLHINSPGGAASGVLSLVNTILESKTQKPIIAYTETIAASAAYWIAAACSEIVLGSSLSFVGSIGVYSSFMDYSKALAASGVNVIEITAGKYKSLGSPYHSPTTDELSTLQENIDSLYTEFVNSTAQLRNVPVEDWIKLCDGRTYNASFALANGMADRISSLEKELSMTTPTVATQAVDPNIAVIASMQASVAQLQAALTAKEEENISLKAFKDAEEAKLKDSKDKEKLTSFFKETLKRAPTAAELTSFASMDSKGQDSYLETLKTTFSSLKNSSLFKETALASKAPEDKGENSLLAETMRAMQEKK